MKKLILCFITMFLLAFTPMTSFAVLASSWSDVHTGFATRTSTGYTEGCEARLYPISSNVLVTALATSDYNSYGVNASLAGAYLQVTGPSGAKVNVLVSDEYPNAAAGSLDLYNTAFDKLAPASTGKINNVTWKIIKRPITSNFTYSIKEGSNPWWAGIQVRDHKYPVLKLEYYKDGKWNSTVKQQYNYFTASNMGSGPFIVRITDIRGKSVTDTINTTIVTSGVNSAYLVSGHAQLPD